MSWSNASPECLLGVWFLGGKERKPWERATGTVSLCGAVNALCVRPLFSLSALQNSISSTCCFIFAYLIFMVTNCKEQNHSVTQYNLNCITRSALLHFPPAISIFFPELHCTLLSWLCSEPVSALFTRGNWPFVDCGTWIDVLIHQLISGM